jgi:hypothetical protein
MRLSEFLGKKLTDIGVNAEENHLVLTFTGGHQILVGRDDLEGHLKIAPKGKVLAEDQPNKPTPKNTSTSKTPVKKTPVKKTPVKKTTSRKKTTN